jgi:hypothetical protein
VLIPGAGHGNLNHDAPELYTRTILDFCRSVAGPP